MFWLVGYTTFSLNVRPLFPCFLPSNPIYHQLSHRECFYLLVLCIFVHMIVMQRTYSTMEVVQKSRFETSNKHTWLVYSLSIIGHTVRSSIALATSSFGPSPLISLQPPHNWMVLIEVKDTMVGALKEKNINIIHVAKNITLCNNTMIIYSNLSTLPWLQYHYTCYLTCINSINIM